ncbi:hypothetical protein F7R01_19035 [Pseudomonas argentinensis]|uniref:Uncharacterized protein n=1 Tax=Phytopseudomonas argentinensis TaxID=289370 RepID=A0A1I3M9M5_9GAMM|nr:hypothetical protein [Pseudomonas argentinensis]KAB0546974.1 hypothetical protein F7R01_19035 [Pseudomonas argentinensis]SFI93425.1 hypothetical protein SAMN05216602_3315 [Pseudomonas argentinensis]
MQIPAAAIERLLRIDWFANIGKPASLAGVRQIDHGELGSSLTSDAWEATTLEARNAITARLARLHPSRYQAWNDLAGQAKTALRPIWQKLPVALADDAALADLQWILHAYLMEAAYSRQLAAPLFFASLVRVYEAGHVPCGWDGEWPAGRLVIC